MKNIAIGILAAAAFSGPVLAADMAVKAAPPAVNPVYNWTGFYGGISAGWEERNYDWRFTNPSPASIAPFSMSGSGGVIGAHVGAQYQWSNVVVGIEYSNTTHINNSDVSSVGCGPNPALASLTCSVNRGYIQTAGGKLGWAGFNNWLIYASGGWAETTSYPAFVGTATGVFDTTIRKKNSGSYAGFGVDYVLYKGGLVDVIVGGEYQHLFFDTSFHPSSADGFAATGANAREIKGDADIVRAKLSIKWNPFASTAVVAKY